MSDTEVQEEVEKFVEEVKEETQETVEEIKETVKEAVKEKKEEVKEKIAQVAEAVSSSCPVSSSSCSGCPAMCGDVSISQQLHKLCSAFEKLPSHDCTKKILLWDDIVQSGLLFGIINLGFFLVCICKYSLVSLVGYAAFVTTISSILFRIISLVVQKYVPSISLDNPVTDKLKTLSFHIDDAVVEKNVKGITEIVNAVLSIAKDVFGCKNIIMSAQFASIFYIAATIGKCVSGTTFLYLGFLIAFIAPRLYIEKKQIIDEQLAKVKSILNEMINKAHAYIPKTHQHGTTTAAKKSN